MRREIPSAGAVRAEVERKGAETMASPWTHRLARFGFASRALVYAVIGVLAMLAALGRGGRATDSKGAIAEMAAHPWGGALVATLAVGLVGLGLWFVLQGVVNPERKRGLKGGIERVAKVVGGLAYGGLAAWAVQAAMGSAHGRSGSAQVRSYTARALELPAGEWLVAAAGVVAAIVGVRQIRNGWKQRREPEVDLARMGPRLRRAAPPLGLAGYATQGAVIVIVGVFLVLAAFRSDAREARGFDGALAELARHGPGMALLAVAAAGLLAYAAYSLVEARYRRLR